MRLKLLLAALALVGAAHAQDEPITGSAEEVPASRPMDETPHDRVPVVAPDGPPPPPTHVILHGEGCADWDMHWDHMRNTMWDIIWDREGAPGVGEWGYVKRNWTHNKILFTIPAWPPNTRWYMYVSAKWTGQPNGPGSAWVLGGPAYFNLGNCWSMQEDAVDVPRLPQ